MTDDQWGLGTEMRLDLKIFDLNQREWRSLARLRRIVTRRMYQQGRGPDGVRHSFKDAQRKGIEALPGPEKLEPREAWRVLRIRKEWNIGDMPGKLGWSIYEWERYRRVEWGECEERDRKEVETFWNEVCQQKARPEQS